MSGGALGLQLPKPRPTRADGQAGMQAGAGLPALRSNSSLCVLQSFKVPLNGTFIFLPAEGKVLLNSQAGKSEFTQMEQLAQTTEQIPATNPFHTSKERKKGMAGAGQSKQAVENSNPLAGIFSCYFSFHIQAFLDISRFSKAERAFAFIRNDLKLHEECCAGAQQPQNIHCLKFYKRGFH